MREVVLTGPYMFQQEQKLVNRQRKHQHISRMDIVSFRGSCHIFSGVFTA